MKVEKISFLKKVLAYFLLWVGGYGFWGVLRVKYRFFFPWPVKNWNMFLIEVLIGLLMIGLVLGLIKFLAGNLNFLKIKKEIFWFLGPIGLILIKLFFQGFNLYYLELLVYSLIVVFFQQLINFGYFFEVLSQQTDQKNKVIWYAAAGFAWPHIVMVVINPPLFGLKWFLYSFLGGLGFGLLRQRYQSIYPSWATHFSFYVFFGLFFRLPVY